MVKKIAMGSIAVTRARKGQDADYYEIVTDTDNFHLDSSGKWDNSMLVQYVHVVGATRTPVAGAIKIIIFNKRTNQNQTFATLQVPEQGITLSRTTSVMSVAYLQVFTMLVETKAIITLSDNASKASDKVLSVASDGTNGDDGETPTISTSVLYSSSTKSATQPADNTFTLTKVPSLSKGDYLWCKETTTYTYTKNTSLTKSTTRYWVSRIGDDGATGKGIHVAYATDANGKDFSTTWFAAATYIGIYVGSEENDPTDPKKYDWSRIKGEQGDPGIQGLILRDSIWQEGYEYHNDKDLKTDGIRYLDYTYLKKTTGSGYCVFVCNKTHTSSSSNKPTTKIITNGGTQDEVAVSQGNWTAVNNMGPLYTPLLIAENADFQFGQTNRLLIMNSKNQVQGCFGGVEDETNGYPLWVGGTTAAAAKFRVKFDGSAEMQGLKATQADISGKITASSGSIGGFTIQSKNLFANLNGHAMTLSPDNITFVDNTNYAQVQLGVNANYPLYISSTKRSYGTTDAFNKAAVCISAYGNTQGLDVALLIEHGFVYGLRQYTRVVSSSTTLSKYDSQIIINVSDNNQTITLPSNPELGQRIELYNAAHNAYTLKAASGHSIQHRRSTTNVGASVAVQAGIYCFVVYINKVWYWEWIA